MNQQNRRAIIDALIMLVLVLVVLSLLAGKLQLALLHFFYTLMDSTHGL